MSSRYAHVVVVTGSFEYIAKGCMGFVYDRILFHPTAMTNGTNSTLGRVKSTMEQG